MYKNNSKNDACMYSLRIGALLPSLGLTIIFLVLRNIQVIEIKINDRAERHNFWSQFLLFILLFFFPLFLGGKRKEEKNNQSRDQKSCLYARSDKCNEGKKWQIKLDSNYFNVIIGFIFAPYLPNSFYLPLKVKIHYKYITSPNER